MVIKPTPEHVDKRLTTNRKEYKPKVEPEVAKPKGITRKGDKFKVTLEYDNKRIHIGYYKTLDDAKAALDQAHKDAGIE